MASKKQRKPINQDDNPWDIVQECVSQADITDLKLMWEYIQEFLRGDHLIIIDKKGKKIIRLGEGVIIPGTDKQITGAINAPKDPHITTLDNGITAKAYSNIPFLMPQVRAATGEDEDQDAAVNSTHLLMYYREANNEEELYKRIVGWLKPAGNSYMKDYWDSSKGDYAYAVDKLTGQRSLDEKGQFILLKDKNGKPMKTGDITSKVNPPQRMLIPPGIPYDDDLPWIGEENAMPVNDIFEQWGVKVEEETDLEDLNSLNFGDYSNQQKGQLKGHARVREIYFPPSTKYPYGRLIIASNHQVLHDAPWDKALTERYPDEWHPYTHIGYKRIEGDYWYKTQFEYLIDLQIQLNKVFKQIMDSLKYVKGAWLNQKDTVDWNSVNWDSNGLLNIEFNQTATAPPTFINIQVAIQQLVGEYNSIIQRMNDIAANYEVSRGNNIPGVKSGKQVQMLQSANTLQVSPLLGGIAAGFLRHWRKILRLCAVHYEDTGRLVRITGQENEAIAFSFTPDQIKSEDIILGNGNWFFMDPQDRQNELDRLYSMGLMGDPKNPLTQKRYAQLRGIGGGLEDIYADLTADIRMAKAENQLFKQGEILETDPTLINQNPLMKEYQAALLVWQQNKMVREGAIQEALNGNIALEQMAATAPPPDPGPEPEKPKIYRVARPYDDHPLHIQILNQLCKSTWFEKMCQKNPELRIATDFHRQSHVGYMTPQLPLKPSLPVGGGLNIPQSPPLGNPGQPGAMGA
jgi:hypothetical protein